MEVGGTNFDTDENDDGSGMSKDVKAPSHHLSRLPLGLSLG